MSIKAKYKRKEEFISEWKNTALGNLPRIRNVKSKRISSWDKTGGNDDFIIIHHGVTAVLADVTGAGVINHFWCTIGTYQVDYWRRIELKMRWGRLAANYARDWFRRLFQCRIVPNQKVHWSGKISFYRFHIEDPIHFEKSLMVTIEHGHANRRNDDYSSTAYWVSTGTS